jgi:hypothetical protein
MIGSNLVIDTGSPAPQPATLPSIAAIVKTYYGTAFRLIRSPLHFDMAVMFNISLIGKLQTLVRVVEYTILAHRRLHKPSNPEPRTPLPSYESPLALRDELRHGFASTPSSEVIDNRSTAYRYFA